MLETPAMNRLDRLLVSTDWLDLFSDCIQRALARPISDHCPMLLETGLEDWGHPSPLRFEISWLYEKNFEDLVKEWCSSFSVKG